MKAVLPWIKEHASDPVVFAKKRPYEVINKVEFRKKNLPVGTGCSLNIAFFP